MKDIKNKSNNIFKALLIIFVVLIIAIFLPPITGLAQFFDATNYYALLAGLIGGFSALLALSWQFKTEAQAIHNEKIIKARGYFELNYASYRNSEIEKIKSFIHPNSLSNDPTAPTAIVFARLISSEIIYDCKIVLTGVIKEKEKREIQFGLIVPSQIIVLGVPDSNELLNINISYTTIMKENIAHKLEFKEGIQKFGIETFESSICGSMWETKSILFPPTYKLTSD